MGRISTTMLLFSLILFSTCKKENDENDSSNVGQSPEMRFSFAFDPDQERLDNFGEPSDVPDGHAAQTPEFQFMSAHYVELSPNALTPLGQGEVLYTAPETTQGGESAIDFDQSVVVAEGEDFLRVDLSNVEPGTYNYLRVSLAYQQYGIDFLYLGNELQGTLASFIGFNTYINSFEVETESVVVNANKLQGYWAFETLGQVLEGQAPEGATTVVNPLFNTSPIPSGSCVVTGEFSEPLVITGNESQDISVLVSLSINQSFEWVEVNADGQYEPSANEQVVDMGIRGMVPTWE